MQAHGAFAAGVEELGAKMLGGAWLQPTSTATSVRAGADVTDGPFAETHEQLGAHAPQHGGELSAYLERLAQWAEVVVVDGSVLPTSLGVNPQESIYGIARWASEFVAAATPG